jgi:hypothetical protein
MPIELSVPLHRIPCGKMPSIRVYVMSAVLVILALAAAAAVTAAEAQQIELTDGSVITGEVVSMSGGIYTVRSATLGTLQIDAAKIRSIRLQGSAGAGDTGDQVKSLEDKMMGDSGIMDLIGALQNDPDFQKILQDPQIMKAVQAGDIAALMKNPAFTKLLDKQAVQDINRKLSR